MSKSHPIISVTGSSGAGTSTIKHTFEQIFRRENLKVVSIDGDAFHKYDRTEMKKELDRRTEAGDSTFSHFSYDANLLEELEGVFKSYSEMGNGKIRNYVHDQQEASTFNISPGHFTPWREIENDTDLLFYEGLHGAVVTKKINLAKYPDLKIGVVPVINLEWIQKIHRDRSTRGYSTEAVTDTILRRMHAYVHCIIPQFTETDINFQRVPVVDTSNPLVARWIPTADESLVVIRFKNPDKINFPYFVAMIDGSWMSRPNSLVIPGGKLDLAMQLILTPLIEKLIATSKKL